MSYDPVSLDPSLVRDATGQLSVSSQTTHALPTLAPASTDEIAFYSLAAGNSANPDGRTTLALVRGNRSASVSFGMGATVVAGTLYVPIPNAATILSLSTDANFGSGQTFSIAASIGGTAVTGASLNVTGGSAASATATGANTVTAGQAVALTFSAPVNSPTGGTITLTWQQQ